MRRKKNAGAAFHRRKMRTRKVARLRVCGGEKDDGRPTEDVEEAELHSTRQSQAKRTRDETTQSRLVNDGPQCRGRKERFRWHHQPLVALVAQEGGGDVWKEGKRPQMLLPKLSRIVHGPAGCICPASPPHCVVASSACRMDARPCRKRPLPDPVMSCDVMQCITFRL